MLNVKSGTVYTVTSDDKGGVSLTSGVPNQVSNVRSSSSSTTTKKINRDLRPHLNTRYQTEAKPVKAYLHPYDTKTSDYYQPVSSMYSTRGVEKTSQGTQSTMYSNKATPISLSPKKESRKFGGVYKIEGGRVGSSESNIRSSFSKTPLIGLPTETLGIYKDVRSQGDIIINRGVVDKSKTYLLATDPRTNKEFGGLKPYTTPTVLKAQTDYKDNIPLYQRKDSFSQTLSSYKPIRDYSKKYKSSADLTLMKEEVRKPTSFLGGAGSRAKVLGATAVAHPFVTAGSVGAVAVATSVAPFVAGGIGLGATGYYLASKTTSVKSRADVGSLAVDVGTIYGFSKATGLASKYKTGTIKGSISGSSKLKSSEFSIPRTRETDFLGYQSKTSAGKGDTFRILQPSKDAVFVQAGGNKRVSLFSVKPSQGGDQYSTIKYSKKDFAHMVREPSGKTTTKFYRNDKLINTKISKVDDDSILVTEAVKQVRIKSASKDSEGLKIEKDLRVDKVSFINNLKGKIKSDSSVGFINSKTTRMVASKSPRVYSEFDIDTSAYSSGVKVYKKGMIDIKNPKYNFVRNAPKSKDTFSVKGKLDNLDYVKNNIKITSVEEPSYTTIQTTSSSFSAPFKSRPYFKGEKSLIVAGRKGKVIAEKNVVSFRRMLVSKSAQKSISVSKGVSRNIYRTKVPSVGGNSKTVFKFAKGNVPIVSSASVPLVGLVPSSSYKSKSFPVSRVKNVYDTSLVRVPVQVPLSKNVNIVKPVSIVKVAQVPAQVPVTTTVNILRTPPAFTGSNVPVNFVPPPPPPPTFIGGFGLPWGGGGSGRGRKRRGKGASIKGKYTPSVRGLAFNIKKSSGDIRLAGSGLTLRGV